MEKLIFRKPSKKAQAQTVKVSAKAYNAISAIEADWAVYDVYSNSDGSLCGTEC